MRQMSVRGVLALFAALIAGMMWLGVSEDLRWDQRKQDKCEEHWAGDPYFDTCMATHEPD